MRFIIARIGDHPTISFAASELVRLLKEMDSHAVLDVRKYPIYDRNVKNAIWVGFDGSVEKSADDRIFISVTNCDGIISGSNERSVLIAVYRFMYELGCRYLRPGKDGEKIPKRALTYTDITVTIDETASYRHRAVCIEGTVSSEHVYNMIDWLPKVGMSGYFTQFLTPSTFFKQYYRRFSDCSDDIHNGIDLSEDDIQGILRVLQDEITKRSLHYFSVGHGWNCAPFGLKASGWDKYEGEPPEEITEILAQVDGKRSFRGGVPLNTNLCYSNPFVREKMTDSVVEYCKHHPESNHVCFWLADGMNNHCECEECQKNPPSDYYVMMLNAIDQKLTAAGLDTKIVFAAYNDTMWTPENEKIRNPNRFLIMFAPISRSYSTSYADVDLGAAVEPALYVRNQNVMTTSVSTAVAMFQKWKTEQSCEDSVLFDYHLMWDHHYDPGYYSAAKILQKDMANLDRIGVNGMVSCQLQRIALPTALPMYCMVKTLWNKNLTFREIAAEYFTASFGMYAAVVEKYMETLSELFEPEILRGEKPFDPTVMIAQYQRAKMVVDDFKENYIEKRKADSKDWEYLFYHAEAVKIFADAYMARFADNDAECRAQVAKMYDYCERIREYTDTVLDDNFLEGDVYNNLFGWRKTI